MTVIVLLAATLAFRLLGALGVARFATWRVSAHFVPTDVTFMPNHADMVAMVPPFGLGFR